MGARKQKEVTTTVRRKPDPAANPLVLAAQDRSLGRRLKAYIRSCRPPEDDPRHGGRMPTLPGFCGSMRCGTEALEELKREFPALHAHLFAILEDEALNSSASPTLINTYLKEHFGYGEKPTQGEGEQLRLIFEHDALEDGG